MVRLIHQKTIHRHTAKMRTLKIILIVTMLGFLVSTVFADTNMSATIYLTFVTDNLGFYKVRNLEKQPRSFTYENHVLNINQGDTIIWENDADVTTFTIVSNQNLWNDKIGQIRVGQRINYKFDNPGTYTFYVKEASSKLQTIVVGSVRNTINNITTLIPTPSQTATVIHTPTSLPTTVRTIVQAPLPTATVVHTPVIANAVKLPINISATSIAGIIVAIFSIIVTFKVGKNKR
jgi:plastocyanin